VKSATAQAFWYHYPRQCRRTFGGMRHRLYVHLVWTTRARSRLIDAPLARFLCRFLRAMARKERAYILEIGMVQTHVHLLARVHPTVPVSSLVKRLKGASSAVAGPGRPWRGEPALLGEGVLGRECERTRPREGKSLPPAPAHPSPHGGDHGLGRGYPRVPHCPPE
jgi:putative transposase